jgi:hypothetical protein
MGANSAHMFTVIPMMKKCSDAFLVIYCLDNSIFCCANSDGQLSAISKQKDGIFHVVGEIVVVHEVTVPLPQLSPT